MNRFIIFVIFAALLNQGCLAQVVGETTRQGPFVREEGTGVYTGERTMDRIELVSPVSVHVYRENEREETTNRYFEKIRIRQEARSKKYPLLDTWLKVLLATSIVPLFFQSYWVEGSYVGTDCRIEAQKCTIRDVTSVLGGEYFIEQGSRTTRDRRSEDLQSATVSLYINGYYRGELAIEKSGSANADLRRYPDLTDLEKPAKLTFKFRDAYVYSTLPAAEIKNILEHPSVSPAGAAGTRQRQ